MPNKDVRDDYRPGLEPPRFKLGSLMWGFVVLGVIFSLISYLGSHATLLVVLFVLAVVAHVAGNALGTQLRSNGDRRSPGVGGSNLTDRSHTATPADFAPTTQLGNRSSLGRPIVVITSVGTVFGAVAGGLGLSLVMQQEVSVSAVGSLTLGMFAAGVLGGIWTFLAASFLQVSSNALRQATRDTKKRSR